MPAAGGRRGGREPLCELGGSRQTRPGPPGIPHETETHRTSCPRSRGCRRLRCVVCNRCWTAGAVALAGGARVLTGRRGGTRSERNGRKGGAGEGTCAAGWQPRSACRRHLAPQPGAAMGQRHPLTNHLTQHGWGLGMTSQQLTTSQQLRGPTRGATWVLAHAALSHQVELRQLAGPAVRLPGLVLVHRRGEPGAGSQSSPPFAAAVPAPVPQSHRSPSCPAQQPGLVRGTGVKPLPSSLVAPQPGICKSLDSLGCCGGIHPAR